MEGAREVEGGGAMNRGDISLELAGGLLILALGLVYGAVLAPLDGWITPREQIVAGATIIGGATLSLHAVARLIPFALKRIRSWRKTH